METSSTLPKHGISKRVTRRNLAQTTATNGTQPLGSQTSLTKKQNRVGKSLSSMPDAKLSASAQKAQAEERLKCSKETPRVTLGKRSSAAVHGSAKKGKDVKKGDTDLDEPKIQKYAKTAHPLPKEGAPASLTKKLSNPEQILLQNPFPELEVKTASRGSSAQNKICQKDTSIKAGKGKITKTRKSKPPNKVLRRSSEPKLDTTLTDEDESKLQLSISSNSQKDAVQPSPSKEAQKPVEIKNKREKGTLQKDSEKQEVISKQKASQEIRRSSRIKSHGGAQPFYAIDKLSNGAFQDSILQKEIFKQEQILIDYAKQQSLVTETKYKLSKELDSKLWFKNYMNENHDHPLRTTAKAKKNKRVTKTKAKDNAKTPNPSSIIKQEKHRFTIEDYGLESSQSMTSQSCQEEKSSSSEFILKKEHDKVEDDSTLQKESAKDELEELLNSAASTKERAKEVKSQKQDDPFLQPLPVRKRQKKVHEPPAKIVRFKPDASNPMDLTIRDHFTNYCKFVDFRDPNTENELYGPAQIQKKQQKQERNTEENLTDGKVSATQFSQPESELEAFKHSAKATQLLSTASCSQILSQSNSRDAAKSHFIKKQQSQCNIKRECGVSYVKKSESKQVGVRKTKERKGGYEKLPPIVIQGSYTLPKNKGRQFNDQEMEVNVKSLIDQFLFEGSNQVLVVTAFESINEITMKRYLLKPHKRLKLAEGKYWLVSRKEGQSSPLENLWRFIKDKYFVCIHFAYDPDCLIKSFEPSGSPAEDKERVAKFILESDICLGILPKKGNASVKSMLKVYKLEHHYSRHMLDPKTTHSLINCDGCLQFSGVNTVAFLSRLELYVNADKWLSASLFQQSALTVLINDLEDRMSEILLEWNKQRTARIKVKEEVCAMVKSLRFDEEAIACNLSLKATKTDPWPKLDDKFGCKQVDLQPFCPDYFKGQHLSDPLEIVNQFSKMGPIPITLINTRDCFAYDLLYTEEVVNLGPGRENVVKKEYYFDPRIEDGYPTNLKQVLGLPDDADMTDINNLKVGVTCYENFYSPEELTEMERLVEKTEEQSLNDRFLPMTAQKTYTGNTLKRTKFFFGYRYMWTRLQLLDPLANVAGGVRADVSDPPQWMKQKLEKPLVDAKVIDKDFINSIALNVYHDGSEGLAQHFDDATRFKQPIFTLRLFSDSRLSFGSQYYGFQNSAFMIPLPRGCICKMEEGSYSANGVKHCVRPCDMTGKSSAVILRQMHANCVKEAEKLDRNIDLPMWLSAMSLEEKGNAVPFYNQKDQEHEHLEQLEKAQNASKNPSSTYSDAYGRGKNLTNDEKQVRCLMEDMLNRIEAMEREEVEATRKIEAGRAKLGGEGIQCVKLFKHEKQR